MKFKSGARLFQSLNLNKFNVPLKCSLSKVQKIIKKHRDIFIQFITIRLNYDGIN